LQFRFIHILTKPAHPITAKQNCVALPKSLCTRHYYIMFKV
jgi:hypothetical protein